MRLLLLVGTSEARLIAGQLEGVDVTASLAGVTRTPLELPCETRIGGFGGEDGFSNYLKDNGIDAVIDATHPFAVRMSHTAAKVCQALDVAQIQLLRPAWRPEAGDIWTFLDSEDQAAAYIAQGSTVFLGTGRQTLDKFGNLSGCKLICRQIDPPEKPFPFPNGQYLIGRPPFSIEDEIALFRELGVDWLVVKNSGANASRSKLDAARELGMPVGMIRRPPQPECACVATVNEILSWVNNVKEQYDKLHS